MTTPITFDTAPSGITYVERDGSTLGYVMHGRDAAGYELHSFFIGNDLIFRHPDPVTVRRRIRRMFEPRHRG